MVVRLSPEYGKVVPSLCFFSICESSTFLNTLVICVAIENISGNISDFVINKSQ